MRLNLLTPWRKAPPVRADRCDECGRMVGIHGPPLTSWQQVGHTRQVVRFCCIECAQKWLDEA
jgi:hypothetical protein